MRKSKIVKYLNLAMRFLLLTGLLFGCQGQPAKDEKPAESGVDSAPCLVLEDQTAVAGDEITVLVSVKNNPSLMTMAVQIEYDTSVMDLTGMESGEDFQNFSFVKPKNVTDGCRASWFNPEPEEFEKNEVELLILQFQIHSDSPKGEYLIRLSCPNDAGIVDVRKESVTVKDGSAKIKIT